MAHMNVLDFLTGLGVPHPNGPMVPHDVSRALISAVRYAVRYLMDSGYLDLRALVHLDVRILVAVAGTATGLAAWRRIKGLTAASPPRRTGSAGSARRTEPKWVLQFLRDPFREPEYGSAIAMCA